jgi:hypothetical protein
MKNARMGPFFFNVLQNRVLCKLKMFFFSGQWGYWIWCSEFVSFDLLSQRCSICMIGT